jgi:hypothetical protein
MWTRSYWVLITYIKRPLAWLISVATLLCILVSFYLIDDRVQSVDNEVVSRDAIGTFEQLELVLANNPAKPVQLDYRQLFNMATQKVFPVPRGATRNIGPKEQALIHAALKPVEGLQNVVAMEAGYAVDQATIDRIARFKTLQRLSISVDLGYESLDLRPLAKLTQLEELQLGVVSRVDSLKPLMDLPRLLRLRIGYGMLLHKHGLKDLARLPHLQELFLPDLSSFSGLQNSIIDLSQSQTLKRIHYGVSWDDSAALAAVRSQVAGIQVKPSKFRLARHIVLFFALLIVAMGAFPIMQLAGQFSVPFSYLAPLFGAPHYLVAGLIVAPLILVAIGGLVYVGVDLLTASSIILFASSLLIWSETQLPRKDNAVQLTRVGSWLVTFPIAMSPFLVLASRFFRPMLVEDYLMSGHILIPIASITIAVFFSWFAFCNLQSRLRERLERGLPAVLSFKDLQAQSARWPQASYSAELGCPVQIGMKLPIVAKTALAVTLLSIPMRALGYEDLGRMALLICLGSALVCVYLTGVKWWQNMPYFAASTIRPPDRIGHVNRLTHGVRSDMLSLTPLLLACVIAIGLLGPWQLEGIGIRLLHSLVAVTSVTLAIYAALLWVLTIRSVIGIAIVLFIGYLPCSMMMMEIVLLDQFASPLNSAIIIVVSGFAVAAISVIAIILVKRYFVRVEWARFN